MNATVYIAAYLIRCASWVNKAHIKIPPSVALVFHLLSTTNV